MKRQQLAHQIRQVSYCSLGLASVYEIDRINILQASLLAMRRAVAQLRPVPQLCLVDGNQRVPGLVIAQQTIIKGDQKRAGDRSGQHCCQSVARRPHRPTG